MRYYLKGEERATIKGFTTDSWTDAETRQAYNENKLEQAYKLLTTGKIDYFYQVQGRTLYVYTRSTREEVVKHVFWKNNGGLIPVSHEEYTSLADFQRRCGYIPCSWLTLKMAA